MGMVVIDDVAEMTKEMWAYLDTVVKGKVMDIVDDLRKDPYEEERQYKREARLELGNMLDKAADTIEQLRGVLLTVLEACKDVNSPDRKVREEITRTVRKALKEKE